MFCVPYQFTYIRDHFICDLSNSVVLATKRITMNIRYLWDVDFLLFPTIYNMRLKSQFQKNIKLPIGQVTKAIFHAFGMIPRLCGNTIVVAIDLRNKAGNPSEFRAFRICILIHWRNSQATVAVSAPLLQHSYQSSKGRHRFPVHWRPTATAYIYIYACF